MSTLDQAIGCIEKGDEFVSFLLSVGRRHRHVTGFRSEMFWHMEQPFLSAVKQTLDERFTDNMDTIYRITIKCMLRLLISGFEDEGSEA